MAKIDPSTSAILLGVVLLKKLAALCIDTKAISFMVSLNRLGGRIQVFL